MHGAVFRAVICAPITTFFDTHTTGMVLNRFSKDTEVVDSTVPEFLLQVLTGWTQVPSPTSSRHRYPSGRIPSPLRFHHRSRPYTTTPANRRMIT